MEIKATTIYDLEAFKALQHVSIFRGRNPKKQIKIWFITSAIFLFLCILDMFYYQYSFAIWVLLEVIIAADILYLYFYFFMPKIKYKSSKQLANAKSDFLFTEDGITVTSHNEGFEGSSRIGYPVLVKVMETKAYFFIFIEKHRAYIVDKSSINKGQNEELEKLLRTAIPASKYIICKY